MIQNIASILEHGILPKNVVNQRFPEAESFAWDSVQSIRTKREVTITGKRIINLHDMVPLFFNPDNPTLHVKHKNWNKMAVIGVNREIMLDADVELAFTNGNAARNTTVLFRDLRELVKLDWKVIFGQWEEDKVRVGIEWENWKTKRCSEFLVYPSVKPHWFKHISVAHQSVFDHVNDIVAQRQLPIKVIIDHSIFPDR